MILRYTPNELRKLADQAEAFTALYKAGYFDGEWALPGNHPPEYLRLKGENRAHLHWWQDREMFIVEFLDFTPDYLK